MKNLQINTDLNYSYDNFYYQDNFAKIDDADDTIIYTCDNQLSSDFYKSDFFTLDEVDIIKLKLFIIKENLFFSGDLKKLDAGNLLDIISNELDLYYLDLDDIEELYNTYNLSYKKNYYVMYSQGYNQGDALQILINKVEFFELMGCNFIEENYQKYFDNILWDAEIYGNIEIKFNHLDKNYIFDLEYNDICNNTFELDLNIDYILKYINKNLHINLSTLDALDIISALNKLDYTNIKN